MVGHQGTLSMSTKNLSFGKGGEAPDPTRLSDNLRSEDTVEVLLGLGEGPWSKLHNGLKSFFIANTPLMATDGTLNFPDAKLIFHKGSELPDPIKFVLGGSASGTSVSVNLAQNESVTRTTTSGAIDAIDVRLRIDQLMLNTEDGDLLNEDLLFRVEVKATSSTEWSALPPNTGWIQNYTPVDTDPTDENGDAVDGFFGSVYRRTLQLQAEEQLTEYEAQVQAWAEYQANVTGPIDASLGYSAYADNVRVYGRTSSPTMKEIRIPVARLENDTYDIRVTKISPESTTESIREITWDTFEEIIIEEKSYPNTAMAQLLITASDQLANVPQMYGIYDTTEVLVPDIYDPETRSYDFTSGPWDGTFKKTFTNDLAWIIYDMVHNDTHGIAAYFPIEFSKYEALEASLYWNACNVVTGAYEGVPRATGGTRPRTVFNGIIDTPRNSMEQLTYMAGAGNAVFYEDAGGIFRLRIEKDTDATQTFNNMDIEGRFQYSFSDVNSRYNDITVVYRNQNLPAYREDRRRVYDAQDILDNGRKPFTFAALGCTDTDEALARAYHKLITSLTETREVTFTTTRFGAYVEPHDIILIADETMDEGVSRRCMSTSADNQWIYLNEPWVPEAGITDYVARIQTASGVLELELLEHADNVNGSRIRVDGAVPVSELDPNFSLSIASATEGDVRPYRVISIAPSDDGEGRIVISAVEVNRSKFALIDNYDGTSFDVDEPDNPNPLSNAVTDLAIDVQERATANGKVTDIEVTWAAPTSQQAGATYVVRYSHNAGDYVELMRGSNLSYTLENAKVGQHTFTVTTVLPDGTLSPEIRTVKATTVEPNYGLPSVTGITVRNRKNSFGAVQYIGSSVEFEWSVDTSEQWEGWDLGKPHPDFDHYQIELVSSGVGLVADTIKLYDWNAREHIVRMADILFNVPDIRDYNISVAVVDADGNEGSSFSINVVKPKLTLSGVVFEQPNIYNLRGLLRYTTPSDPDFTGISVWKDTKAGASGSTNNLVATNQLVPTFTYNEGENHLDYCANDAFGQGVIYSTTKTVTFTDISTAIADLEQDIDDLEGAYGDATSAAAERVLAEAARDTAETHRDNAQTAQGLAETAQGHAEDAEVAAIEASGVSVRTARDLLPSSFEFADEYFTHNTFGDPEMVQDVSQSANHSIIVDAVEGEGIRTENGHDYISSKGTIPLIKGNTYRITARVKMTTTPTNGANIRMGLRMLEADYTGAAYAGTSFNPTDNDAHTYTFDYTVTDVAYDTNAARWGRPEVFTNFKASNDGDGQFDTFLLSVKDISSETASAGFAAASFTSSQTAASSSDDAGDFASASDTARIAAETAQGHAETAQGHAATSETNAGNSESNASTYADNAADSASDASGFSSAASGHADTANTKAGEAGVSADAAQTSLVETKLSTIRNLPDTFDDEGTYFTTGLTGLPKDLADATGNITFGSDTDGTYLSNDLASNNVTLRQKQGIPFNVGDVYRVRCAIKRLSGTGGSVQLRGRYLEADYLTSHNVSQTVVTTNPATTIEIHEFEFTGTQAKYDLGVRVVKSEIVLNVDTSQVLAVYQLGIENISALRQSTDAASASAASASTASTKANDAQTAANAADTAKVDAQTAQGLAEAAEGRAATSETNADGSASAAAGHVLTVQAALEDIVGTEGSSYTPEPSEPNPNRSAFTSATTGLSAANADLLSVWSDVTDVDMGPSVQASARAIIATKHNYPIVAGEEYDLTITVKAITDGSGSNNNNNTYIRWLDSSGASAGVLYIGKITDLLVANGVRTFNYTITIDTLTIPAGAESFKIYMYNDVSDTGCVLNVHEMLLDRTLPVTTGDTGYLGAIVEHVASASTSRDAASDFADDAEGYRDAAEGFRDNANTYAQAALGYRGAAETAAGDAEFYRDETAIAVDDAEDAAAAAKVSQGVVARIQGNSIMNNPIFAEYDPNQTYPKGYTSWGVQSAGTVQRGTGIKKFGDSVKIVTNGSDEFGLVGSSDGLHQGLYAVDPAAQFKTKMVLEGWFYLAAGPRTGAGLLLNIRDGNTSVLIDSLALGSYTVPTGRWVHLNKMVYMTIANAAAADNAIIYIMGDYSSFGANSAKTLYVAQASLRPATQMEIEANKVAGLEASVTATSSALADVEGNLSAAYAMRIKAGTSNAELELVALDNVSGSLSSARLAADNLILDGTIKAVHFEDGSLYNIAHDSDTAETTVSSTLTTLPVSKTFTSVGKTVRVDISAGANLFTSSDYQISSEAIVDFEVRLYRGTTFLKLFNLATLNWQTARGTAAHQGPKIDNSFVFVDEPNSGTYNYNLKGACDIISSGGAAGTLVPRINNLSLLITEIDN